VRTGLHLGEVETRGEEVSGLAVHAAARVMALAGADQVFVTDAVADVVGSSVALRELGSRSLRGVPGEWRIYEVGESGAA
jgi:class 3 adenylate cyclase